MDTSAHVQQTLENALRKLHDGFVEVSIEKPKVEEHGDFSCSIALKLAKPLKTNPMNLAQQIAGEITPDDVIEKVDVIAPGFINFWLTKKSLSENLKEILNQKNKYGTQASKTAMSVIVEYSSPNIAKPFTIGHLRSTIIGDAVANLMQAAGYTVYRDNHVGDWGTQFGKQIYAIKTWGDVSTIEHSENPVKMLVELYVRFHQEAENDPSIEEEGRMWFKKLEDGDKEARDLWSKCIEWSWKEFHAIYKRLNVSFTENEGRGYGESYFEDYMQTVIDELCMNDLLKESEGAQLVFFPKEEFPPLMIIKKDGATLYATRDLATDYFRKHKYGDNLLIINEVGIEQSLYFRQIFKIEELMGWFKKGQRVHIGHGLYRFADKKMSTRKGNTIWLTDVLDEAKERASQLGKGSDNDLSNDDLESIGIGALKWNDLKRDPKQDIVFSWDDILTMNGDSGPYMQYTYVRCKSVIKDQDINTWQIPQSINDDEMLLLRMLVKYPITIASAAQNYAPNILCVYLFKLAQQYNSFYQKYSILKSEESEKQFRLALSMGVAQVIQNGLHILGIKTVNKM